MAKVTITIQDHHTIPDAIFVRVESDPPANDMSELTIAHRAAMVAIAAVGDHDREGGIEAVMNRPCDSKGNLVNRVGWPDGNA